MSVCILGGHGLGDCILSLQCAHFVKKSGVNPFVAISTRDEVFGPLYHLFKDDFQLSHVDNKFANDNAILKDEKLYKEIAYGTNEFYYVIPDLLFNNKYAFDYKRYHTFPQTIKAQRLLTEKAKPSNIIYVGLITSTPNYDYQHPVRLALRLAEELPNYRIVVPMLERWANIDLPHWEIPDVMPSNLIFDVSSFENSIKILSQASYFIGTDNGPSHIAYHYGIPRLLLDPQYGRLPWVARWREDVSESIPISTSVSDVVSIVKLNLTVPQTCLVPRIAVLNNQYADWTSTLFLKKE